MHTLTINIDNSIYENFIGLLAILPKEKIKVIKDNFLPYGILDEEIRKKVKRAMKSKIEYTEEEVFAILEKELNENHI